MSINSINASCEVSLNVLPGLIFINTSGDSLSDIQAVGYLNGQSVERTGFFGAALDFSNLMQAVINTTDAGVVTMQVVIDGENINLVPISAT